MNIVTPFFIVSDPVFRFSPFFYRQTGGGGFLGGYSGYFSDLDGHLWEVAWNPGFALNAAGALTLPE